MIRTFKAIRLIPILFGGTTIGQTLQPEPVQLTSCFRSQRIGRRIISQLGFVEFHLPLFANITKVRDVDYVEYFVRYGSERDKVWLKFMFGLMVGGHTPQDLENTSIKWTARRWYCREDLGITDWQGIGPDRRRWRHIAIPFGFASYENTSPKAADYFDKILSTMCCANVKTR